MTEKQTQYYLITPPEKFANIKLADEFMRQVGVELKMTLQHGDMLVSAEPAVIQNFTQTHGDWVVAPWSTQNARKLVVK